MPTPTDATYILLAEDNPADVFLVRRALEERGIDFEIRVVADGADAVRLIERIDLDPALTCPELLLMDLHLPRKDGEEVLRFLRASRRCAHTPVVIMTSSDSPYDRQKAARHAALHYFLKPSSLDQFMQLGAVVEDILRRESGRNDI